MAAKKVKKPRVKWLKACNGEPFSVECIGGNGSLPPFAFVGDYGFRSVRDIERLCHAVEEAAKWLEDQKK